VNVVIMWIGIYVHWWILLMIVNIWPDSNYVSYLLVLIHLVNIFDDNHFGNSNEVKFVYV